MKVCCVQLNMLFGQNKLNFSHAENLIRKAVSEYNPDTIVMPETWATGYFPTENIKSYCENNCDKSKLLFHSLSKELNINIVAGSVMNLKNNSVYNTSLIFNRNGECVAEYDKTHLFTPMGEQNYFDYGDHLSTFELDGEKCGIIICYDLRFPELVRSLALKGIKILFIVSQWPDKRVQHLKILTQARAIENQMFTVCCNSCGKANSTQFGGNSSIVSPWGEILALAQDSEQIISADCDFSIIQDIRNSINVFNDRKNNLYDLK